MFANREGLCEPLDTSLVHGLTDTKETGNRSRQGCGNDDTRNRSRKPKEVIEDLEAVLTKTKTLGLRNAIRMTLKDLYKGLGEDEKVLEHLRAMLAECDQALQKDKK